MEKNVFYFEEIMDAESFVFKLLDENVKKQYPDGFLFVTMGAGDNWKLRKSVYEKLISKVVKKL